MRLKQAKVKEETYNLWVVLCQFLDNLYVEESQDLSFNSEAEKAFENVRAVLGRYQRRSERKFNNQPIYNKKEKAVED